MKIYIKNFKEITHLDPITCSSFNRLTELMNKYECIFITAFRGSNSKKKNRELNKQLIQDIHNSDLTYIKCNGGFIETNNETGEKERVTEESFCVANNGYRKEDFIKLGISWCKKYDQDAVLITFPVTDKNTKSTLNVIGRYYDKSGNIDIEFDHATVMKAEEYFTNAFGKDFVLSSTMDLVETDFEPYEGTAGYVLAKNRFEYKYPTLICNELKELI